MHLLLTAALTVYGLVALAVGYARGLWREAALLLALLNAALIAWPLRGYAGDLLLQAGCPPLPALALGFPAAFMVLYAAFALAITVLRKLLDAPAPTFRQRLAGGALGLLKAGVIGAATVALLGVLPQWRESSPLIAAVARTPLGEGMVRGSGLEPYVRLLQVAQTSPEQVQAIAQQPEIRAVAEYAPLQALTTDTELRRRAQQGDIAGMLSDPQVTALLRDPEFRRRLQAIDLQALADTLHLPLPVPPPH